MAVCSSVLTMAAVASLPTRKESPRAAICEFVSLVRSCCRSRCFSSWASTAAKSAIELFVSIITKVILNRVNSRSLVPREKESFSWVKSVLHVFSNVGTTVERRTSLKQEAMLICRDAAKEADKLSCSCYKTSF